MSININNSIVKKVLIIGILTLNSLSFLFAQNNIFIKPDSLPFKNIDWKQKRLSYYLEENKLSDYHSLLNMGLSNMKFGLFNEAIGNFKEVLIYDYYSTEQIKDLNKGVSKSNTYLFIAVCFDRLNERDSSEYFFDKALIENPFNENVFIEKATSHILRGEINKSKLVLTEAESRFDKSVKIISSLAGIEYLEGNYETAKKLLDKALIINPTSINIQIQLAAILFEQGKIEEAVSVIKTSDTTNTSSNTIGSAVRGSLFLLKGDYQKAFDDYNRIYLLDTANIEIVKILAQLELKLDYCNSAITKLIRINTSSEDNSKLDYLTKEFNDLLLTTDTAGMTDSEISVSCKFFKNYNWGEPVLDHAFFVSHLSEQPKSLIILRFYLYWIASNSGFKGPNI